MEFSEQMIFVPPLIFSFPRDNIPVRDNTCVGANRNSMPACMLTESSVPKLQVPLLCPGQHALHNSFHDLSLSLWLEFTGRVQPLHYLFPSQQVAPFLLKPRPGPDEEAGTEPLISRPGVSIGSKIPELGKTHSRTSNSRNARKPKGSMRRKACAGLFCSSRSAISRPVPTPLHYLR